MFPDFQYLFHSLFGIDGPAFLSYIKTFGFCVATAFLAATVLLRSELKRKELLGLLKPVLVSLPHAKKFLTKKQSNDEYPSGNVMIYPHQRVGDIVMIALVGGLVGAKIFNALETWKDFIRNPIESLFSGSGLTFYGGLIVAAALIYYYCKKHSINFSHFCDAMAPVLMLAYGIGRLGCHFAGDGDWGIFNSAYVSLPNTALKHASPGDFRDAIANPPSYFMSNFGSLANIPNAHILAPRGLPTWLYAMNFPHNVISSGVPISGCKGTYCAMLPVPVFPTSLYEAVICMFLFVIIWLVRKKTKYALHLFGFYLILNGIERFLIEQIKVNYKYNWGFVHPAQSEIIAVLLVLCGLWIVIFHRSNPIPPDRR
jgi:phosphatidylglycerol:prolipoprotein diacylglycerol transferase